MHSVLLSKLFFVTTVLRKQQCFLQYRTILSRLRCTTYNVKPPAVMAVECFKGAIDCYSGVTVDSRQEPCDKETFVQRLNVSMREWLKQKIRVVWFRIYIPHTEWIPILTEKGFKFHHAKEEFVMLYLWVSAGETCNIPPYAHTDIGVGAFVYNEKTNEVLVIKERHSSYHRQWKLPGGYVEPNENFDVAIRREVMEETGIDTTFKCFIAFRHGHNYHFGCSDVYMIAYLTPSSLDVRQNDREICACQWMKLDEYLQHSEVHEFNKELARKVIEFFKHRMGIVSETRVHPVTKKPMTIYTISKIDIGQTSCK